jgi:uncharacterized membrane protein required for colicin V production
VFLVWVLLFSLHGFLRGTVAQVFVVLGLFAGVWAGLAVWSWLGGHWTGAQPAMVYVALRWIVAGLAGMGAAAIIQAWGTGLGRAVKSSPVQWLDKSGGLAIGAMVGLGTASLLLMFVLLAPKPRNVTEKIVSARSTAPLMATAAHACSLSAPYLPGGPWLTEHFRLAHHRAKGTRAQARAPRS